MLATLLYRAEHQLLGLDLKLDKFYFFKPAELEPYAITDENNPAIKRMMESFCTLVIIMPTNYNGTGGTKLSNSSSFTNLNGQTLINFRQQNIK